MRSRLSAFKFVANNKKTVGTLILAFAIAFMTIYMVYSILICTVISDEPIMLEEPEYVCFMDLSADSMGVYYEDYDTVSDYNQAFSDKREELCEKLKAVDGIEDAFYTQVLSITYKNVIGMLGYDFPLVEADKVQAYMDHVDADLIEGRMPEGDGEIVIDRVIMKNQHYNVGDWFDEEKYGETFMIVGVMDAAFPTAIGTPQGFTNNGWYIVVYNDAEHSDMKALMEQVGGKVVAGDEYYDLPWGKEMYEDSIKGVMEGVISTIMAVIIIFTALAVFIAYISLMRNRVNEYCLYSSIGYNRRSVYGMMIREMAIVIGTGIVIGSGLSLLGNYLLKTYVIEEMGLLGYVWYPEQFVKIIAAFVMIAGILQIPILITMSRIKTIDAIED